MLMTGSVIERVAGLIRGAKHIAVLSGAGISTASGVPDFRSAGGLYSNERNVNVFDLAEFERNPRTFYDFAREFYPRVVRAKPNAAHEVLARLEGERRRVEIATQNVDDFHQRAGSSRVYPIHGSFLSSTCRSCGQQCRTDEIEEVVLGGDVPHCACGGVYKPDITFFGELLPERAWKESERAMSQADLVLIVGTSLSVFPAASLPGYRSSAARLVVMNRDATDLDYVADVVSQGDLAEELAAVERLL